LFQKAVASFPDWPEKIYSEWLIYERENGTLESFDRANEKFQSLTNILEHRSLQVLTFPIFFSSFSQ